MSKPVTYYAQDADINALVDRYGSQLQQLTEAQKAHLLCFLTDEIWSHYQPWLQQVQSAEDAFHMVKNCPLKHKLGLLIAVASQLDANLHAQQKSSPRQRTASSSSN